jgi:hypothetical protein
VTKPTTDPRTLTKAVLRAAEHLGLSQALPEILGLDAHVAERMASGNYLLDPNSDEWAAATRFTGLFRSLLTLLGNREDARAWLASQHQTLGDAPSQLLRTPEGRDKVFGYLDAVQKFEVKLPPRSRPH